MSEETAVEVAPEGPRLLIGGTFAIYADTAGGLVLVTDVEGRGIERHMVPGALVKMMTGNSPMARMVRKMFTPEGAPAGGPE